MELGIENKQLLRCLKLKMIVENKIMLEEIEELSIIEKNFLQQELKIDLTELSKVKNLKKLTIKFFTITDKEIDVLNELKNLETLEILMCKFETTKTLSGNIKNLYIYNAENFRSNSIDLNEINIMRIENSGLIDLSGFVKFEGLKRLEIINCPIISIPKLNNMKLLEELYLENNNLQFDLEINNLKNLKFISLNGSKVENKKEYLEKIKIQKPDIKIEFKEDNNPIE